MGGDHAPAVVVEGALAAGPGGVELAVAALGTAVLLALAAVVAESTHSQSCSSASHFSATTSMS